MFKGEDFLSPSSDSRHRVNSGSRGSRGRGQLSPAQFCQAEALCSCSPPLGTSPDKAEDNLCLHESPMQTGPQALKSSYVATLQSTCYYLIHICPAAAK